jgi:hypothetical protein
MPSGVLIIVVPLHALKIHELFCHFPDEKKPSHPAPNSDCACFRRSGHHYHNALQPAELR